MITELKQLRTLTEKLVTKDEELYNHTNKWEYILDAVQHIVIITTDDYETTFVNKAAIKKFGVKRDHFLGKRCNGVKDVNKRSNCDDDCDGEFYSDVLNSWYEYSRSSIIDDDGSLLGYIFMFKDITKRKKSEKIYRVLASASEVK